MKSLSTTSPTSKRVALDKEQGTFAFMEESIDTDKCCACFGVYDDDLDTDCDWVQCSCSRDA